MDESDIFKFICANRGAVNTDDLCNLGSANVPQIIGSSPRFLLWRGRGGGGQQQQQQEEVVVVARTCLRLCRAKDCPGTCSKLHLCKHFLFSGSCSFRGRCIFSHELSGDHNDRVRREHEVESLSRAELCTLLLQNDHTLMPSMCHDYNNGDGEFGRCQGGVACERLHVCERYVTGDCSCSRTHDFSAPQPLKILKAKDVTEEIILSLRSVYRNKEALRSALQGNRPPQQPISSTGGYAASCFTGPGGFTPRGHFRGRGGLRGNRGTCGNRGNRGMRGYRRMRGNRGSRGGRGNQDGPQQLQRSGSSSDIADDLDELDLYTEDGLGEGSSEEQQQSSLFDTDASSGYQGGGYQGNRGKRGGLHQEQRSSSPGDLLADDQSMGPSEGLIGATGGSEETGGYRGNQGNRGNYKPPQKLTDDPNKRPRQWPVRDKTEICLYFIKGHCKHEDKCFRAHDKMPYRWEVREGSQWTALTDNEAIEKDFCDPENTYSVSTQIVNFATMTCGSNKVRRLSTCSSVAEPTYMYTTEWVWHWEDEKGRWNTYASSTGGQATADVDSSDLEKKFLDDPKDVVEFSAGSQSYSLSFKDMKQRNKHYTTERHVRRRPRFVSAADIQAKRVRRPLAAANLFALPDHWDKTLIPATGYKRVPLQPFSVEYMEIEALFSETMRGFHIVTIERIQNKALWESFQLQRTQMKNKNGGRYVTEKKLFHGTDSKHVDAICLTNFDWRICGTHGTSFGKGSYFARDAKYSHCFTCHSDVKSMFVSRVLVGHFTRGASDYCRPPSKDRGDANLYDSCVDDTDDPSIYVVFERHQIYPEYLLQYSGGVKKENPPVASKRTPAPPNTQTRTPAPSNTASSQPSNLNYNPRTGLYTYKNTQSPSKEDPSSSCAIS